MAIGAVSPTQIINTLCIKMYKSRMLRQWCLSGLLITHPEESTGSLVLSRLRDETPSDTPEFVGLLWTNDQPVSEPVPDNTQPGIRTQNSSKRAAEDLRLRPRGHFDRSLMTLTLLNQV
jgi:hypothetical protein